MDETLEKKLRALKLKLVMAEKELQAAGAKWKLGGFLGAGHANAMNREVDKVKSRLNETIEKIKAQIAEITGDAPVPQKVAQTPAPKPEAKKPAAKPDHKKTEQASVKKPAQKTAAKTAKKK